jgi:hypothetical protein
VRATGRHEECVSTVGDSRRRSTATSNASAGAADKLWIGPRGCLEMHPPQRAAAVIRGRIACIQAKPLAWRGP